MNTYLFESWAKFGKIHGTSKVRTRNLRLCFLLINKEKIIFKSQQMAIIQEIVLRDITDLVKGKSGSDVVLKITTSNEQKFMICVALAGSKKPDNYGTTQLYSFLLNLEGIKGKSDQLIIDKLRSMFQVSPRINITVLKEVLGVETSLFYQNIYKLAAQLGLTVDGDYLKVDKTLVSEFIKKLNESFQLGISEEKLSEDKFSCPYCGSPIKSSAKFCTHCGTNLVKEEENEKNHE
ncbi:MAG: zinc ribbon domain-containing protein [Promethearchaeota archaeon]